MASASLLSLASSFKYKHYIILISLRLKLSFQNTFVKHFISNKIATYRLEVYNLVRNGTVKTSTQKFFEISKRVIL